MGLFIDFPQNHWLSVPSVHQVTLAALHVLHGAPTKALHNHCSSPHRSMEVTWTSLAGTVTVTVESIRSTVKSLISGN